MSEGKKERQRRKTVSRGNKGRQGRRRRRKIVRSEGIKGIIRRK